MKLIDRFPEYHNALMHLIGDKNPIRDFTNDKKTHTYFLKLSNFKNGFDYYELFVDEQGNIRFKITTMIGLKVYLETHSDAIYNGNELSMYEWHNIIYSVTMTHFFKEEYKALKHGYVKKGQGYGCLGTVLLISTMLLTLLV